MVRLEGDLQAQLHLSGIECRTSLSKVSVRNAVVGCAVRAGQLEVGVVQRVKRLCTELHVDTLSHFDFLVQRCIPAYETRSNESVTAQVSGAAKAGSREGNVRRIRC